jgi:hypothetical protein
MVVIGCEAVGNLLNVRGNGEVSLKRLDLAACCRLNLLGNFVEFIYAARDQDEVVTTLCETVSVNGADSRGSPSDKGSTFAGMTGHGALLLDDAQLTAQNVE